MEAKSQEFAAYRFHEKLRREHRVGFAWNYAHGNYGVAFWHYMVMSGETFFVMYHRIRIEQTTWYQRMKGGR